LRDSTNLETATKPNIFRRGAHQYLKATRFDDPHHILVQQHQVLWSLFSRFETSLRKTVNLDEVKASVYSSQMKKATITEAKNQLSALIDRVRHGETIVITDRGRPVARLVSALTDAGNDPEGRLARLQRRGGLRLATSPPLALIIKKLPKTRKPSGVLDALLDERKEGR
jgi:prevent-host-death family protein